MTSYTEKLSSAGASGGGGVPPMVKMPTPRPLGDCMGIPVTCPLYAYPVGTVVFDANNHETN